MFNGIGASPGITLGRVKVFKQDLYQIEKRPIIDCDQEIIRLIRAFDKSKEQIQALYDKVLQEVGKDEASIFEAHLMILEDETLMTEIKEKILIEEINSEVVVECVFEKYIEQFKQIENDYFKERALDLKDVANRIIENLLGIIKTDLSNLKEEVIIVAKDLTPSDTVGLDGEHVKGFVTESGGKTSHSAIIARTLEIPAVVGVKYILKEVKDGDFIIMDGDTGKVVLNPEPEQIVLYENRKEQKLLAKKVHETYRDQSTITKDNRKVDIAANIGTLNDLDQAIENGAEGIGLFRTEFLYLDQSYLPTEEEQFQVYKQVAIKMNNQPVIIRTLDIGGDKEIPYLNMPKEMNPFLGYRAIRLCLNQVDIFLTQLKALLRASCHGNIKIMFPMISSMEELKQAKGLLDQAKKLLDIEKVPYNDDVEIGMMIEVPSAALLSDQFAKEVDFFSIGTNDLIQYTVAVDRGNENISYLYSEYNPGVLRLIHMIIKNAHCEGIWVGMCGEAASNEKLIPLLLAMGLDEFSMSSSMIPRSRYLINNLYYEEVQRLLKVLNWSEGSKIEKYLCGRELDDIK
ncbi:phosphoenolpyruvate--protein phosphotransferase [Vallitalea okinawensis]|uniref:phosphoenolpyruvate--protein phosphotransferase n=1 Tax=Vallitalea okinawensis TaxID=2078660 RepID=UPI000CFCF110|nr:phosphoenolpyruvate--protein phosphotransferase [Vallitalea okinawensis]